MRVISQDRMIDVPYGQISVERRENEIWCGYSSTMTEHCTGKLFAKYSTEEKSIRAMEMLHDEWRDYGDCGMFTFPEDSELEEKKE